MIFGISEKSTSLLLRSKFRLKLSSVGKVEGSSNHSCSFLEDTGFCLSPFTIESSAENTLGMPSPLSPLMICSSTRCSGGLSALTNLFFKDEVLADGAKDWVQKFMLGVFSPPSISVAGQFASGVDLMYEGQFLRGAERIIPAQFIGLAVALRLGKEGSETPTGMRLLDPEFYTTGKLIAQGIGFKTVTEEQISKANFAAKGYENKLEIERNQFLKRLNNAYRDIEKADSKDVDSLWLKFDGIVDEMIKFSIVNPVSAFTSEGINTSLRSKVEAREKSKYTKGLSTSSDKKLDLLMQLLNREYE